VGRGGVRSCKLSASVDDICEATPVVLTQTNQVEEEFACSRWRGLNKLPGTDLTPAGYFG